MISYLPAMTVHESQAARICCTLIGKARASLKAGMTIETSGTLGVMREIFSTKALVRDADGQNHERQIREKEATLERERGVIV
jgi:hypothetical protein